MRKINILLKDRIFRVWLLCYIIIILITSLLLGSGYVFALNLYENELCHSNDLTLRHILSITETAFSEADTLSADLVRNRDLRDIVRKDKLSDYDRVTLTTLLDSLRQHPLLNGNIDSFCIYLPQTDYMISSSSATSTDVMMTLLKSNYGIDRDEYISLVQKQHSGIFYAMKTTNMRQPSQIVFFKTLFINAENEPTATVSVFINLDKLSSLIETSLRSENSNFIICDSDSNTLFSVLPNNEISHDAFAATMTSQLTGWNFTSTIPKSVLFEQLALMRNYFIIVVLFSLILVFCMAVYFTSRNFMPIAELNSVIRNQPNTSGDKATDSINRIKNALISSMNENTSMTQRIKQQSLLMKNAFMQQLYSGEFAKSDNIGGLFDNFELPHIFSNYYVIRIFPDDISGFCDNLNSASADVELAMYAAKNILEEILPQMFDFILSEEDCSLTLLLTTQEENITRNNVIEFFNDFCCKTQSMLSVTFLIGISNNHNDNNYRNAYDEATCYINNSDFASDSHIITEQKYSDVNYTIDDEYAPRLLNSIKSGNAENTFRIIKDLVEDNIKNGISRRSLALLFKQTIHIIDANIYKTDTFNIFYRTVSDVIPNAIVSQYALSLVYRRLSRAIYELCICFSKKNFDEDTTLSHKIKEYISLNYSDINLSTEYVAMYFKFSRNYISKLFKDETGSTLSNYISTVRMNNAKEMLIETDMTISKIAQQCGYLNDNTFTRIFKKCEGVTPGQYRSINKK